MELEQLKYPIGRFSPQHPYNAEVVKSNIQVISALPSKLINLTNGWDEPKVNTPYRPDGWTVRQLIHHIADSHMNAYMRIRLTLTEDHPTIKPYKQDLWAELPDAKTASIDMSLQLIRYIHLRLVVLLNTLTPQELSRTYHHPEMNREYRIDEVIALYAWHSEHHYQHLFQLAKRNNWH
jgi:hypothetical protein